MFQRNPRTRKVVKYGKRDRHPLPLNASHFQPQVESAFNSHTHGHGVDVKWPAFADSSSASEESDSPKTPTTPQEPLRCDPQSVSSKKAKDIGRSARDWGTTFSQPNGVAHALSEICFGQNSHDRLSEGVQQAPKNDLVELWGDQVPKRPEEAALPESPAPRTRPRRHAASLPVGELVLVPSHQIEKQCASPVSDSNEISAEDSIHSQASTAIGSHADFKINSKDDMLSQRPPATSAHAYRPLAKKLVDKTSSQLRRRPSSSPRSLGKLRGDGFHASELHIGVAHNTLKRCSKPSGSLTSVFRQLELTRGPLPTVDFGDSTSKIDLAVASTRADDKRPQARIDRIGADREAARSNTSRRSTSPRIRAQNELVMAQLSSISAPARQWSLSDDSDDEDEDSVGATSRMEWAIDPEHEQSQSEDVLMDNVEDDGEDGQKVDWAGDQEYQQSQSEDLLMDNVEDGEEDGQPSTKTSACATSSKSYASLDAEGADTHVRGVTFDFRQHAPGKTPVALRGRRLVEVNDAIIEDPDMHLEAGFHPDEPASSTNTLPTWSSLADEPTYICPVRRPRSILKSTTQSSLQSSIRHEDTDANTRRNSAANFRRSRYFEDTVESLARIDPTRMVVLPRGHASAPEHAAVQVPFTDHVVKETSPERPPGGETHSFVDGVRKKPSGTSPAKPALSTGTKDLKSLTRSVSRQFGTLSQSSGKRPSLRFQSPAKAANR